MAWTTRFITSKRKRPFLKYTIECGFDQQIGVSLTRARNVTRSSDKTVYFRLTKDGETPSKGYAGNPISATAVIQDAWTAMVSALHR